MSDDIAEFLRRAAQRYGAPQAERREVLDAEIVEDAEILDPGEVVEQDVSAHVARHMDTSGFARRVSTLGDRVERSDDRMEVHLQSTFQHELGQLGARTSTPEASALEADGLAGTRAPEAAPRPSGVNLVTLLHDTQQLRNALILSEILQRPEHRW